MTPKPAVALVGALVLSVSACSGSNPSQAAPTKTPSAVVVDDSHMTAGPGDASTWTVRPGAVGPIKVGMTGPELVRLGYAVADTDGHVCSVYWRESEALRDQGIYLDFVLGDRDDLDQIILPGSDGATDFVRRSDAGVAIGDSVAVLEAAYDEPLYQRTENEEGGPLTARTAFSADGALSYGVAAGKVTAMYVTRGSDVAGFQFPALGC